MTLTKRHSALMLAALVGATLSTAAMAEKGPMGPMPMMNFEQLDSDKDGKVTKEEMAANRAAKFTEADTNKDGKLSMEEMMAMREKAMAAQNTQRAKSMLDRIDTDKDGFVSAEEAAAMPGRDKMFERMDENADGAITLQEMDAMKAQMAARMEGKGKGDGKHDKHGKHGGGFWSWMGADN